LFMCVYLYRMLGGQGRPVQRGQSLLSFM
jgi:hypothetical protein